MQVRASVAHTRCARRHDTSTSSETELRPGSYREIKPPSSTSTRATASACPSMRSTSEPLPSRLSTIEKNSGPVRLIECGRAMSAMFTWGMREGLALANPVANTNKRDEKARDRVLADAELRLTSGKHSATISMAPSSSYLMLTGQRANEIAGLRWAEIGFRSRRHLPTWQPHEERPAARDAHVGARCGNCCESQPKTDGRDLGFRQGRRPVLRILAVQGGARRRAGNGMAALSPRGCMHDLRRSVRPAWLTLAFSRT